MPHPLQYALWLVSLVLQASAGVLALTRRDNWKFSALGLYMLANAGMSVAAYFVLEAYGFVSPEYRAFYAIGDAGLVVALFFAILSLYQHVLEELHVSRYITRGAALLITLTAAFSFITVQRNSGHMAELRYVVELGQNLYFVGVVLAYLLWGAVMQLRETRLRILQFVFALGIYFSASAATYAMVNLFPGSKDFAKWVPVSLSVFLSASWLYTMTFVPDGARLATARIAGTSPASGHAVR